VKFGLIMSNDWELFGDGSGDYFEVQHKPLQLLLNLVDERGGKLTLMAEIGQQFAHYQIADQKRWAREIVDAWEAILKKAVQAGNDVQMHLHPQWLDAEHKDGKWRLNYNKWAICNLGREEMEYILRKGKAYLENLLKPLSPTYECIAFRAGAYCIQPSLMVTENLRKVGIVCDTSVVPGMYNPPFVDFRGAFSNVLPWYVDSRDVRYKGQEDKSLLEIPICSYSGIDIPILRRYISRNLSDLVCFGTRMTKDEKRWLTRRQTVIAGRYPVTNRPFDWNRTRNGSVRNKLRWIFGKALGSRTAFALDYDQLSSKIFVKCVQKIYESSALRTLRSTDLVVPLMVTGHVKNMHDCENIARIFDEADRFLKELIVHWTLRDAVKYWLNLVPNDAVITT
jgi:hypothetical protein